MSIFFFFLETIFRRPKVFYRRFFRIDLSDRKRLNLNFIFVQLPHVFWYSHTNSTDWFFRVKRIYRFSALYNRSVNKIRHCAAKTFEKYSRACSVYNIAKTMRRCTPNTNISGRMTYLLATAPLCCRGGQFSTRHLFSTRVSSN